MNNLTLYNSDCRHMSELADNSVHCIVSSPPYFGLRRYAGLPDSVWDGDDKCGHVWGKSILATAKHKSGETNPGKEGWSKDKGAWAENAGNTCSLCGAWKGQLGNEPSVDLYISHLMQIMGEMKKKLRPDGVCFINISDSYANAAGNNNSHYAIIRQDLASEELDYVRMELSRLMFGMRSTDGGWESKGNVCKMLYRESAAETLGKSCSPPETFGKKSKGLPKTSSNQDCQERNIQQVTARQDDEDIGREVRLLRNYRSKIPLLRPYKRRGEKGISKGNRPIGDLSPGTEGRLPPRQISDSLLELQRSSWDIRLLSSLKFNLSYLPTSLHRFFLDNGGGLKPKDLCLVPERFILACQAQGWFTRSRIIWWKPSCMPSSQKDRPTTDYEFIYLLTKSPHYFYDGEAIKEGYLTKSVLRDKASENWVDAATWNNCQEGVRDWYSSGGRNCRTVWSFPSGGKPAYLKGHYATFVPGLPERCIKAGTSEHGVCSKCGKQWERVIEHKNMVINRTDWGELAGNRMASSGTMVSPAETKTIDWRQACSCKDAEVVGATVLDPFAGTGTTLAVARKMGRQAVGYELSPAYIKLIEKRNSQGVL